MLTSCSSTSTSTQCSRSGWTRRRSVRESRSRSRSLRFPGAKRFSCCSSATESQHVEHPCATQKETSGPLVLSLQCGQVKFPAPQVNQTLTRRRCIHQLSITQLTAGARTHAVTRCSVLVIRRTFAHFAHFTSSPPSETDSITQARKQFNWNLHSSLPAASWPCDKLGCLEQLRACLECLPVPQSSNTCSPWTLPPGWYHTSRRSSALWCPSCSRPTWGRQASRFQSRPAKQQRTSWVSGCRICSKPFRLSSYRLSWVQTSTYLQPPDKFCPNDTNQISCGDTQRTHECFCANTARSRICIEIESAIGSRSRSTRTRLCLYLWFESFDLWRPHYTSNHVAVLVSRHHGADIFQSDFPQTQIQNSDLVFGQIYDPSTFNNEIRNGGEGKRECTQRIRNTADGAAVECKQKWPADFSQKLLGGRFIRFSSGFRGKIPACHQLTALPTVFAPNWLFLCQ